MIEGTGPAGRPANAVVTALARVRRTGLDLADDLLTHLPDLGDPLTQRAVDGWVEQAADTLRAVAESVEERLLDGSSAPSGCPSGNAAARGTAP
jgi:hypothetical protein